MHLGRGDDTVIGQPLAFFPCSLFAFFLWSVQSWTWKVVPWYAMLASVGFKDSTVLHPLCQSAHLTCLGCCLSDSNFQYGIRGKGLGVGRGET